MTEDINRLPKWAQRRMAELERELGRARSELADTRGVHLGTNVRVYNGTLAPDTTLPPDSQIDFYMTPSPQPRTRGFRTISVRHKDARTLYVMGDISGVSIVPQSNNSFEVTLNA
jgi:hypothetical protein